jgi:hypothetical protein
VLEEGKQIHVKIQEELKMPHLKQTLTKSHRLAPKDLSRLQMALRRQRLMHLLRKRGQPERASQ